MTLVPFIGGCLDGATADNKGKDYEAGAMAVPLSIDKTQQDWSWSIAPPEIKTNRHAIYYFDGAGLYFMKMERR